MAMSIELSRRRFLYGTALAASAVTLAACQQDEEPGAEPAQGNGENGGEARKGSATEPLPAPSEYHEAPMLTELVEAGDLPPVEERLPDQPYVVPHNWLEQGQYGGTLQMIVEGTSGSTANSNREYMYGHSILRWLNDGLDIGPGLAESWEQNEDATEWTFHFREGLKWSDGEPWTTADIMFWWEDIVNNEDHAQGPPDEARSGTGTLAEFDAPDDFTLVMTFDAPAPLTADRVAMWVNGGIGFNGPIWMLPRHYLEQFHPTYNPDAPADWASAEGEFEQASDFARSPDCPTMTGWHVVAISEGQNIRWERNPYYWCVTPQGDQLPYLDELVMNRVEDREVAKLQVQEGRIDYVHGPFFALTGLADISSMRQSEDRHGMDTFTWDSGSGTGSMFFFNYDHQDETYRELIREPKFRQALSLAVNREDLQRAVYFETGERTTGTLSPKAIEYQVNDEGVAVYEEWRDSYVDYDPEQAMALLDEIGVVDANDDGFREMPDGSQLIIRLDHPANADDEHLEKNNHLERDWGEIGIRVEHNPVAPEVFRDQWEAGRLDTTTAWEVGDGPNHLVFPQWLVPIEPQRWAPLEGQFYNVRGTPEEGTEQDVDPLERTPPRLEPEAGGPIEQIWDLYDQSKVEPDEMERHRLVWETIKIHVEHGPFFMGTVANTPRVIAAKKELRNIPRAENLALSGFVNPWIHPTPAVYDPEIFYWENPDEHSS